MKLSEIILLEGSSERTKKLELQEAVNIAKKNYTDCLSYEIPIVWRGSSSYEFLKDFILVDPMVGQRTSLGSGFGYTELISNLPSWKGYPSRQQCIIGSSSRNTADAFGETAVMLLPNKFKAVVTERDMWGSFKSLNFESLDDFDRGISDLIFYLNNNSPTSFSDFQQFTKNAAMALNELHSKGVSFRSGDIENLVDNKTNSLIEKLMFVKNESYYGIRMLKKIEQYVGYLNKNIKPNDIFNYFNEALDPDKNKIRLTSSMSVVASHSWEEVWTSNTCMIIPSIEAYKKLREKVLR